MILKKTYMARAASRMLIVTISTLIIGCNGSGQPGATLEGAKDGEAYVKIYASPALRGDDTQGDSIDISVSCVSNDSNLLPQVPEVATMEEFRFLPKEVGYQFSLRISLDSVPFRELNDRYILLHGYFEGVSHDLRIRTTERYNFVEKADHSFELTKDDLHFQRDTFPYSESMEQ